MQCVLWNGGEPCIRPLNSLVFVEYLQMRNPFLQSPTYPQPAAVFLLQQWGNSSHSSWSHDFCGSPPHALRKMLLSFSTSIEIKAPLGSCSTSSEKPLQGKKKTAPKEVTLSFTSFRPCSIFTAIAIQAVYCKHRQERKGNKKAELAITSSTSMYRREPKSWGRQTKKQKLLGLSHTDNLAQTCHKVGTSQTRMK